MSRSGYSEDCEYLDLYRASVERALAGRRGQAFLRELLEALDELEPKELIAGELVAEGGGCCAIGAVCKRRGLDVSDLPWDDDSWELSSEVGKRVGIARSMAAEIAYENDEGSWNETPAERWTRVRAWVAKKIREEARS